MVLAEAAWSSGASGIACEAVIAASPRPKPLLSSKNLPRRGSFATTQDDDGSVTP
jgi:hypothetical protein